MPEADIRAWELVTDVPELNNIWAYVCLILNVLIPGTGTMLCSCLGDANLNKTQLCIGFIQFLTAIYLIGWICSIYWGYLIVLKSKGDHEEIKRLVGQANTASENAQNLQKLQRNPYEDK